VFVSCSSVTAHNKHKYSALSLLMQVAGILSSMVKTSDKQYELDKVRRAIVDNNICPELAATATNLVMGDGNIDAEIMFIGEAPGKNEDEQGLPFVGAAGKFLNEMLAQAGMARSDVYITNIVKYRPPNNRDPLPEEKAAFWPYLLKQLQIIQPKVVITLGRHSMEYFLPDMKISLVHGQAKRIKFGDDKIVIVPLYHPAAALYNGSMRQTLVDDFLMVPEIIKKL
jgi:uracil-DNA glycosylase family 4